MSTLWPTVHLLQVFLACSVAALSCGVVAADNGQPPPAQEPPRLVHVQSVADDLHEAQTQLQKNQLPQAIMALRAALAIDPTLFEVRQRLAETLVKAGRTTEAKTEYERLHAARPSAASYALLIEARRTAGALVEAMVLAQAGAQAFPADARITWLAAELLLQLKDPRAALTYLDKLPVDTHSDALRGTAHEALGQWAQAYRVYARTGNPATNTAAESGRLRALQHAVKLDRTLVFAPAGWAPVPNQALMRNTLLGLHVSVERRAAAEASQAVSQAIAARLPASLLAAMPDDVRDSIAAKSAEHKPGAAGHFDVSALVMKGAFDLVTAAPMKIKVERIESPSAVFGSTVTTTSKDDGNMPDPVYALTGSEAPVVFVVTRIDAKTARELLLPLAAAHVVQE